MQPRAWNFLSVRNHSSHAAHTPTPPSPQLPPPNLLKPVNFIIRELAWGSMWTSTPQLVFREHMTQLCFHAFHNNTLLRHADLGPNPECCDSLGCHRSGGPRSLKHSNVTSQVFSVSSSAGGEGGVHRVTRTRNRTPCWNVQYCQNISKGSETISAFRCTLMH